MLRLRVEKIKKETADATTFLLSDADARTISYRAGQFITLVFEHHGEELRRSYSISSSPDEAMLAITIKRVPNGEISRFLLARTKPGDIWNAVEPAGKFVLNEGDESKDVFFFAAGSGIAPIFAQIKYILRREGESRLTLFYSNQNKASVVFAHELAELEKQHPSRLEVIHLLSSEAQRLNNILLEKLVNANAHFGLDRAEFYLCGPFDYMRMVRLTLIYMGVEPGMIRKENFVLPTVPVSTSKLVFAPRKLQLIFGGEIHDLVAGENQSILQAALQNNIPLPYSCRAGICSTCAALCTSGKVTITQNDVLTDADLAAGWILTCTGYAVSDDVVIKI